MSWKSRYAISAISLILTRFTWTLSPRQSMITPARPALTRALFSWYWISR